MGYVSGSVAKVGEIMHYWLMKSEPTAFSIDDLINSPKQTSHWDGVRNYQARNTMRDQMQVGDKAFFYHSSTNPPGIVGIMAIVKKAYPDFTAFDINDSHYDAGSKPENPRWFMVDVRFERKLKRLIPLEELKQLAALQNLPLVKKGTRLSIMPMNEKEWQAVLNIE